ncbi:MAG: DUF3105 domain-containing protein [Thermomicrobiales bacterium]
MGNQQRKSGSAKNTNAKPRDPKPGPVVKSAGAQKTSTQNLKADRADAIKSSRVQAKLRYEKNQREMRIIRIGGAILALLLIGGIGYGIFSYARDQSNNTEPEKTVANYSNTSGHVEGTVQYAQNPPVGGEHNAAWQNCGYYSAELNNENAVHSLEHGAVWITYQPDLPQDQIDTLKSIAESQDYILVSPYPGLDSPVVASSWNHQIKLDGASDPDLKRFINVYKQGPDTPEPGASCSGAVSTTK